MPRSLVLPIALFACLAPSLASAQATNLAAGATSAGTPIVASPGTNNTGRHAEPGVALTLTAGARAGAIQGHDGPTGVVGPLGGIDLLLGHQLAILDENGSSIALVYHGSIFAGVDQPLRRSQPMIEQRHGIGFQARIGSLLPALTGGLLLATLPELGTTLPGGFLTAHLGFGGTGFYFGLLLGGEAYVGPAATLISESIGLSIGGTTM